MFKIRKFWMNLQAKKLEFAGSDKYGNKYYINKATNKRYCLYNGIPETSKIPPEWHSFMHGGSDTAISDKQYDWQVNHTPNTTGTRHAHFPHHSIQNRIDGEKRCNFKSYTPWNPGITEN